MAGPPTSRLWLVLSDQVSLKAALLREVDLRTGWDTACQRGRDSAQLPVLNTHHFGLGLGW